MCGPLAIPIALFAISTALTAASAVSQQQAQKKQAQALTEQNAEQTLNIQADERNKFAQAQNTQQNINNEAYQKLDKNAQQEREARATATTAAGDAGVSGISVDALQQEYFARGGQYASDVKQNQAADMSQIQFQEQGFGTSAQSQENSLAVPNFPNFTDTALRIGAGAADAYGKYLYTPSPPKAPSGT